MFPNRLPPYAPPGQAHVASSSSSTGQPPQAGASIPRDLSRQFTLMISGVNGADGLSSTIERIVVPPRRRNEADQLDDLRIVRSLHNIVTAPHTWTVKIKEAPQQGRALTYTRNDAGTNTRSPIVTLTINRDGVLHAFEMRSAQSIQDNDSYIAHFADPLAAPQAVRLQQMPSWLANAAFNEAGSSNPRRITPPTPPHAKRTRVTTPPISPRTHALLQQAARSSPVAPDPGVNLALLDAPTLSIVRPDGLLVDLQGRTLEHPFHQGIAIGKAYGSHASNQAFQGNVVGLSLQGARIDQIRRVLAQQREVNMDDVGIIVDPAQGMHSEAELQVLDSMHPEGDVSYDTARQALEAQFNRIDENDENGPRYLSVRVPQQGHVLPPAPLNPHGAYLPNLGFVPLEALQGTDLAAVAQLHGQQARERLQQAIEAVTQQAIEAVTQQAPQPQVASPARSRRSSSLPSTRRAGQAAGAEARGEPVGAYDLRASDIQRSQTAHNISPEPNPLKEPQGGWPAWAKGLSIRKANKTILLSVMNQLLDPGIHLSSLRLDETSSLPSLSEKAMRVLLASLAAMHNQTLTVGNLSRTNLIDHIKGFAEGQRLRLSLGMAAILPPVILRDVIAERYLGVFYSDINNPKDIRKLASYFSKILAPMGDVVTFLSSGESEKLKTMHASGLGNKTPDGFVPSHALHENLHNLRIRSVDGLPEAANALVAANVLFAAVERRMDAWAPSPFDRAITKDDVANLFATYDELKGTLKNWRYASLANWLVDVLKDHSQG